MGSAGLFLDMERVLSAHSVVDLKARLSGGDGPDSSPNLCHRRQVASRSRRGPMEKGFCRIVCRSEASGPRGRVLSGRFSADRGSRGRQEDERYRSRLISEVQKVAPNESIFDLKEKLADYSKAGLHDKTMEIFDQFQLEGITGDRSDVICFLNACAALRLLEDGRLVHRQVIETGLELNLHVSSSLVDMYVKCGSLDDARTVFSKMITHDVVSWNAMILGSAKCGDGTKALEFFEQMQLEGIAPNSDTYVGLLNACASIADLDKGKHFHELVIQSRFESDLDVGNSLVDMYAKCGSIEDAWRVFDRMNSRTVVSWNCMIFGYVKFGQEIKAIELFRRMQQEGVKPDPVTYVGVLKACALAEALDEGRSIHEQIRRSDLGSNVYVSSSLIGMYARCGSLDEAFRAFNTATNRNSVSWSAMLQGYVRANAATRAVEFFRKMLQANVNLDPVDYEGILSACATTKSLKEGKAVHEQMNRSGSELNLQLITALLDMYSKCGSADDAWEVLKPLPASDVVSWNFKIHGCATCGLVSKALDLFQLMQLEGVEPNSGTFVGLLNACASNSALDKGRGIHEEIIRRGLVSDVYVVSSLIDMYSKCGNLDAARRVFDEINTRDAFVWSAIILACVHCGEGLKAFELFHKMQLLGVEPNRATLVGLLNLCASLAAIEEGEHVRAQIIKSGLQSDAFVCRSLIDMYAKCGRIDESRKVFEDMPKCDVFALNVMIMAYALHGLAKEAIAVFREKFRANVPIDDVTFIGILLACFNGGLVKEGEHMYDVMAVVYRVPPKQAHFACLIDIFARSGRLDEAEQTLNSMPLGPDVAGLTSLLRACRIHGNVELGERTSKRLLELDSTNSAGYVLLSNIYAAAGQWDRKAVVQEERRKANVVRQLGCSWTYVNNELHAFEVNDCEHPQIMDIHKELTRLSGLMSEAGYVPDIKFALQGAEDEKNVVHLCNHSEMLAIAYGLISTPPGAPLLVLKNLRLCGQCHTETKFISKIVGRVITVRDDNRFHKFEDGVCSCGDYW